MTMQRLFNKAINATIRQGRKARSSSSFECALTGYDEDGNALHCPVGHLMTPTEMLEAMAAGVNTEGVSVVLSKVPQFKDRLRREYGLINEVFLERLQFCHDSADDENFAGDVRRRAKAVAAAWGLSMRWIK